MKKEEIKNESVEEVSDQGKSHSTMAEVWSWIRIVLIAVIVGLAVSLIVKPSLVVGESMSPTLSNSDYLILNRLAYKLGEPQYKDIIVFHTDLPGERVLIKRVIATEGQHIVIKNNKVYVEDKLLDEKSYIHDLPTMGDIDTIVPEKSLFVMGDNRTNSMDSRMSQVGFISLDDVIGKVAFRLIPLKGIDD